MPTDYPKKLAGLKRILGPFIFSYCTVRRWINLLGLLIYGMLGNPKNVYYSAAMVVSGCTASTKLSVVK